MVLVLYYYFCYLLCLDGYIVAADEDTLLICRRKNEDKIFKFASDVEMQELLYSNVK